MMRVTTLAGFLAVALLVSVSAGLSMWFIIPRPEARFAALSSSEKDRMIEEVVSRLEAQGYLSEIGGFGEVKDGFHILFYHEADTQVLAIVREVIGDLPLEIETNMLGSPEAWTKYAALSDSERKRIVEEVLQELRTRGYMVDQGGTVEKFEYKPYGFRMTVRYGLNPEVMAIVEKHIKDLPLVVVDLILGRTTKP